VVQLLLESGALCERDTFQGERCLYNALNDRIRNLLLSYDYSKSTDPLQPLAAHVTSLLSRDQPKTSDVTLISATESFRLHKFLLAARSPYFSKKLAAAPDTTVWKLPNTIPSQSLQSAVRFLYLSEIAAVSAEDDEEKDILTGVDKLSRTLEIERLFENIIDIPDRRLTRQRRTDEVKRGQDELELWFRENVIRHKIEVETSKAADVKWDQKNGIFADVLLRADEDADEDEDEKDGGKPVEFKGQLTLAPSIPIGPLASKSRSPSRTRKSKKSILFPAHKAMLLRSEFFNTMFSSSFREAQETEYLQIIPIDCSPDVLQVVLTYLYTEKSDFPLDIAIEVLFAADLLFIDKLKVKAAQIISTLGNGMFSIVESENPRGDTDAEEVLDIYDVIRAGWDTRVQRLEEFGARYIARRLERYIDQEEFLELVQESAGRVKARQETDTIELIDESVLSFTLRSRFMLFTNFTDLVSATTSLSALGFVSRTLGLKRCLKKKSNNKQSTSHYPRSMESLTHWGGLFHPKTPPMPSMQLLLLSKTQSRPASSERWTEKSQVMSLRKTHLIIKFYSTR
jgi:ankyrin repeat/BTB/POZ domain-containing protein 1